MKTFSIILIYLNLCLFSQIASDFSAPKFGDWMGDTNFFSVENGMLRSMGPNLNNQTLYLSKQNFLSEETTWQFHLELKFNPNSSNYVRVYLVSDQDTLSKPLEGYFIQFGETNSDTLDFFIQKGDVITKLFTGKTGFSNTISCKIKISVRQNGIWDFWLDNGKTGMYNFEGSIINNEIQGSQYFGIYCRYATASRFNQYYFDDIFVQKTHNDTLAPLMQKINIIDQSTLSVQFSEKIINPVLTVNNSPILRFDYCNSDSTILCLYLNSPLLLGKENMLHLQSVEDISGNNQSNQDHRFIFPRKPHKNEIVFSELMIDESPSHGLPEREFMEVFNLSEDYITTSHCMIQDGIKIYPFGDTILKPKTYYLLTTPAGASDFKNIQNKILLPSVPSLNNTGKTLSILNDSVIINTVTFTDKWCKEPSKCEGGWSLEIKDIDNFCLGTANWDLSIDPRGGSPAEVNSLNTEIQDITPPRLSDFNIPNDSTLILIFNEHIEFSSELFKNLFIKDLKINKINYDSIDEGILVVRTNKIDSNKNYEIKILNLRDCSGNVNPTQDTTLFIAPKIQVGDLLINEILFDAQSGGAEYIELYNNSNHPVNLKNIRFSKSLSNSKICLSKDIFLPSKSYFVFTDNKTFVENHYLQVYEAQILECTPWLQLSDDSGSIFIKSPENITIDQFHYDKKIHNPLINNAEGVSLEKISPNATSGLTSNWQSASATSGFGTPTKENSQTLKNSNSNSFVSTNVISPNGDGRDDFCVIALENRMQAEFANIRVVDSEGRVIKTLASNLSISASNSQFIWDGTMNNNTKASIGAYLIHIEIYSFDKEPSLEYHTIAVFE